MAEARVEAILRLTPNVAYVAGRTVVGIAPSSVDVTTDEMRVAVGNRIVLRAFDPGEPIVTGAPFEYVTTSGEQYVTMTGDQYVAVVE